MRSSTRSPDVSGSEAVYLGGILQRHRRRAARDARNLEDLSSSALAMPPSRGFVERLRIDAREALAVVAEVKRRSPSLGVLREGIVAGALAADYERGGASCISVLTDVEHFAGSPSDLAEVRSTVALPVLRKDFIVDERDVCDARLMGADCVLLIAAALNDDELRRFIARAALLGMDVLVEAHDADEVRRALDAGARLVGVNQRDLVTFAVDRKRAEDCRRVIPDGVVSILESGVRDRGDAQRARASGWHAVLVGESLVRSADPAASVAALRVP